MTWLKHMFGIVGKGKYDEIITLCWPLWRSRSDLIWNQKTMTVYRTVAVAMQYLTQWSVTQNRTFLYPLQPQVEGEYGATVWVKPKQNLVKVLVDAAVFEDRGEVGFGFVARNSDGELIEARAVVHPHLVAPVVAEAMAFKEALSWMYTRGWHDAIIESDCLPVIQAVSQEQSLHEILLRFGY